MSSPSDERGSATTLRGWLSEVYFPSLLDPDALASLATRLGAKATVDDPVHGRASGGPGVRHLLEKIAGWLRASEGVYREGALVPGTDRDVTFGAITLKRREGTVELPVAVVAERRPSREVEMRVYCATHALADHAQRRAPLLVDARDLALPVPVAAFVQALAKGDAAALTAAFEHDGSIVAPDGSSHRREGGALAAFLAKLADKAVLHAGGSADDGRRCAIEHAITLGGRAPQAGLMLFERGDSGLLSALRLFGDLDV